MSNGLDLQTELDEKVGLEIALPLGWVNATLGGIATLITKGSTPTSYGHDYQASGIPFVRVEHLRNGVIQIDRINEFLDAAADETLKRSRLKSDDVLFTIAGTIGRTAIVRKCDIPSNTNQAICIIRGVNDVFMPQFLRMLLSSEVAQTRMQHRARGGAMRNISLGDLKELPTQIPPLAEQTRIVTAIESLQERSSRTRALLAEVKPLIAQLRQSVLRSAFSGRLTADWRAKQDHHHHNNTPHTSNKTATEQAVPTAGGAGKKGQRAQQPEADTNGSPQSTDTKFETATELLQRIRTERRQKWEAAQLAAFEAKGKAPTKGWQDKYKEPEPVDDSELPELPEGWCWSNFDTIAQIDGGLTRHAEKRATAKEVVSLISVAAVQHGYIDSSQVSEIGLLPSDGDKATLELGDLLIVEGNGSLEHIGRAALWDDSIDNVRHQNHLIRVRSMFIDSAYALHWLASPTGRASLINEATSASGLYNLSLSKIARIRIPIAPIDEQAEIVKIVNAARQSIHEFRTENEFTEQSLTQLDQSILSKAFRGELVPQDPNDEPASELLARIRATREATAAKKKPSKKKAIAKKKKQPKASGK